MKWTDHSFLLCKNHIQNRCWFVLMYYKRIGDALERFVQPVIKWRKRECYQQLYDYIYGDVSDRVFILYGLRRTGKTTLIRQLIADMAMKIVLSGTDSLGFMFTKDEALYDRCIMCHTSFIPYR